MKKRMNEVVRKQIQMQIKNGVDISAILKEYSLSGEDVTGAIIKTLDLTGETLEGTNFTRAIIGSMDNIIYFNNARFIDCSFVRTQLPGPVMARRMYCKACSFQGAFLAYVDYAYAQFHRCIFCDTIFSIGTKKARGAYFSPDFFRDLSKQWKVEVRYKSEE